MKPVVRVAAAIIEDGGRFLVARRGPTQKMAGLWEFPGGKIEADETPQQCIVRELAEELAIEATAGAVVAEHRHDYDDVCVHLIAVKIEAFSDGVEMSVHDQLDWVSLDHLLKRDLAPADIPIAEAIIKQGVGDALLVGEPEPDL